MSEIVQIQSVTKRWGDVVGVDDASLSVETGEFVTLLGPSGCGKSTLLRMIGGFEQPTSGTIWLDGRDVTHLPPNRRDVNMVFQDYALFPHMSVGRNVGYGLKFTKGPRSKIVEKALEALDLVGLSDKVDAMPSQLSGGQRQRVALARALVRQPKVLLLDEPLSALDANLREAMQVELRHLHRKVGLTFIMVTHDQDEALAMADRVLVMRAGRVIQDGSPDDLYDRPSSPYVAEFVGSTNLFTSKVIDGQVTLNGQTLDLPDRLKQHADGQFGFRPEKARIVTASQRGPNQISGLLSEVLYHGSTARLVIGTGEQSILVSHMLQGHGGREGLPKPGDEVTVEVAPESLMCFEQEASA
ncbi:Vitamin B12 import ATP-binding protein BtuD (plasmid) [Pseudoseohaeicola sp. NH-UV-7]|uniref:ABC transporter ATP-binding protein n=1 Tax=unclassified Sulfitobacter TaxID=196795 RepID=UPI000E0A04E3|nr:ABC transporter ATP-binding protein [Sulfitobacter sp. JL08]AXI55438.1 Fe3+/spermidine/putrescine ABC transporter ATP-binding protein [Sulfitobacter sp. JL08]